MEQTSGAVGQWIADSLEPVLKDPARFGALAATIPGHYPAYARILHRVSDNATPEVRWADVAAQKGTTLHPAVQFHRLARTGLYGNAVLDGAPYGRPSQGELDDVQLAALAAILQAHTNAEQDVFQAVWVGWDGFEPGNGGIPVGVMPSGVMPDGAGDRLIVAGGLREFWVFRGSMAELALPPWRADGTYSETPNLAWPADRSWCVATEIDFDSTLVGGPAELIAAVVHSSVLEALTVGPDTNLSSEGDEINTPQGHSMP